SLQSSVFPTMISSWVPDLVIGAIATGLGAYAVQKSGLAKRAVTPFLVAEGRGPTMKETNLTVKQDTVGMPIRREGRTIGCVLLGQVSTSFKTPMGIVSASLPGPVTTVGIPFQGRTVTNDEALKMTGKEPDQLVEESTSRAQNVDVGRIRIRDGCMGDRWKIGPLIFDWDGDGEHHPKERWLAKGTGGAYVTTDGHRSTAKWNGSTLSLGDDSMELAVGSDSFSYSPTEVKTASPLHSLHVTQDKITLDPRKFTLKVLGDNVVFRTEDKTSRTESKALANDLRELLTEAAKKQVKDVMEENPIDLVKWPKRPKEPGLGTDFAGVVEAVHNDVTEFKPGDEVYGVANAAYAEYGLARESRIALKPRNSSFEQSAAVPIAGFTALQALRDKGHVK